MMKKTFTAALGACVVAAAASLAATQSLAHSSLVNQIAVADGAPGKSRIEFYVHGSDMKSIKLNWCRAKSKPPPGADEPQQLSTAVMCEQDPAHPGWGQSIESAPKNGFIASGWKEDQIPELSQGMWVIGIALDNGDLNHTDNGIHPAIRFIWVQ